MAHCLSVRVYYEDTDAGGIVYHANYLCFAERARTEMLRDAGYDHNQLLQKFGLLIAVRRCVIDFRSPARLDEMLCVESQVLEAKGAKFIMSQIIRRQNTILATLEVTLAVIDQTLRPKRMPLELLQGLQQQRPDD